MNFHHTEPGLRRLGENHSAFVTRDDSIRHMAPPVTFARSAATPTIGAMKSGLTRKETRPIEVTPAKRTLVRNADGCDGLEITYRFLLACLRSP